MPCTSHSPLASAYVQPTSPVTLPAPFLIPGARTQAAGASFPIGFVWCASNDARAALAQRHLHALAVDLLLRVRDRPAPRTHSYRLRFLISSLFRHAPSQFTISVFWRMRLGPNPNQLREELLSA